MCTIIGYKLSAVRSNYSISRFIMASKQQLLLSDLPHASGNASFGNLFHKALKIAFELIELFDFAKMLQLLALEAFGLFADDIPKKALGTFYFLEAIAGKHARQFRHFLCCISNILLILPLIYAEYNV